MQGSWKEEVVGIPLVLSGVELGEVELEVRLLIWFKAEEIVTVVA